MRTQFKQRQVLNGDTIAGIWNVARHLFVAHSRRICKEHSDSTNSGPTYAEIVANKNLQWPQDEYKDYLDLKSKVDHRIQKCWARSWQTVLDQPDTTRSYTPISGTDPDFDSKPGESLDASLIIRRLLYQYQKQMCYHGPAWGIPPLAVFAVAHCTGS